MLDFFRGAQINDVASRAPDGIERFDQRHSGAEHCGQSAGPAGQRAQPHQFAEDRHAQQQPVHGLLHLDGLFPRLQKEVAAQKNRAEQDVPVVHEKVGYGHHHQRGGGQARAELREHIREHGHDEQHDDGHHHEGHDHHRNRVGERALDLAADGQRLFLIGGQAVEHQFEHTGRLACFDQVAIQRVEVFGMFAKGVGQTGAGFHIAADVHDQPGHVGVGVAATDDVERLQQRHAGLDHGRHLPGEGGNVLGLDRLAAGQATLLHLGDQNALAPQRRGDDGLAARAQLTALQLALSVFPFPLE